MKLRELAVLRTRLRALNIEYSALVRGKAGEGAFARMEELRGERRALMALIAQQRLEEDRERHAAVGNLAAALSLQADASAIDTQVSASGGSVHSV